MAIATIFEDVRWKTTEGTAKSDGEATPNVPTATTCYDLLRPSWDAELFVRNSFPFLLLSLSDY